ncbi:MAG: Rne/Rng family ribonuclease [Nitrospiraceae bacterium]|nr:Rne/Rng family ribonuclease [Nitrospiraceae bacterium]
MKKKILIDAKYPEEKRVAILEGNLLVDFYVELASKEHLRGNIYKGVIARVEPSLQAVFVDFGQKKNGFLQLREIMPEYLGPNGGGKKVRMQEVFQKGQEMVVQIEKDERETKGASLTTFISLPGRYIVMMPGQSRIGISRKIVDKDRERMKEAFGTLKLPEKTGFILRTAGIDKTAEDLSNDLKYLTKLWSEIQKEAARVKAPALIYKEQDIAIRTVRDYLTADVEEVLVDDQETFRNIKSFLRRTLPGRKINVKYYRDKRPIFDLHNMEDQIARINERFVHLPSRGYLVFDRTEALTAIDVNSGRSRKERNIEQTALRTNLEAADEIARQLRLRDMGGLVVIDFIDMESSKNRRQVEARLKTALLADKAHTDITGISRFGIVEMTRERMRTAYFESAYRKCPTCEGSGVLMTEDMVCLSAFREMHMKASRGGLESIVCHIPVSGANYLLNEKRDGLVKMEKDFKVRINVIGDLCILPGQYRIEVHKTKAQAAGKETPEAKHHPEAGQPRKGPAEKEKEPAGKDKAPAETAPVPEPGEEPPQEEQAAEADEGYLRESPL